MYTKDRKILISSSAKDTIKESAEYAAKLNTGLEISRLPFYKDKNITTDIIIEQLKNDLTDFNNRITLHAMFSDVNIAGQDPLLREISQLRHIQSFEVGKAIKADTILFHTGNKGTKHYGSQESFKKRYTAFWKEFIKEFEKAGITAVLENVFEDTPKYCIELLEEINSPNLKLALDTGHVNLYAPKTKVEDWIKLYGQRLFHMHIHNNFQTNDDHSNLENGTLDFHKIFDLLKELEINPSLVLEMFTVEDIEKSLAFMEKIKY